MFFSWCPILLWRREEWSLWYLVIFHYCFPVWHLCLLLFTGMRTFFLSPHIPCIVFICSCRHIFLPFQQNWRQRFHSFKKSCLFTRSAPITLFSMYLLSLVQLYAYSGQILQLHCKYFAMFQDLFNFSGMPSSQFVQITCANKNTLMETTPMKCFACLSYSISSKTMVFFYLKIMVSKPFLWFTDL